MPKQGLLAFRAEGVLELVRGRSVLSPSIRLYIDLRVCMCIYVYRACLEVNLVREYHCLRRRFTHFLLRFHYARRAYSFPEMGTVSCGKPPTALNNFDTKLRENNLLRWLHVGYTFLRNDTFVAKRSSGTRQKTKVSLSDPTCRLAHIANNPHNVRLGNFQ